MDFSVPFNWDPKLIDKLSKHSDDVLEVYGSIDRSITGHGRPPWAIRQVDENEAEDLIEEVHSRDIQFNYLLNAPCTGGREYTEEFKKKLASRLEWLNKLDVETLTVSNPFLIELVGNSFPGFNLNVSVISSVNDLESLSWFEGYGADSINIDYMINRDFGLLEKLRRKSSCNLKLLLNDQCFLNCPIKDYHRRLTGHHSQIDSFQYMNYCLLKCRLKKFSSPVEFLESPWIRPENLEVYEDMGFDTFKIAGRTKDTSWILNTLEAYMDREHDGNLLNLIRGVLGDVKHKDEKIEENDIIKGKIKSKLYESSKLHSFMSSSPVKFVLEKIIPMEDYREMANLYTNLSSEVFEKISEWRCLSDKISETTYLDNSKLDGFIDFFVEGKCPHDCSDCDYCEK